MSEKTPGGLIGKVTAWIVIGVAVVIVVGTVSLFAAAVVAANVWAWTTIWGWL